MLHVLLVSTGGGAWLREGAASVAQPSPKAEFARRLALGRRGALHQDPSVSAAAVALLVIQAARHRKAKQTYQFPSLSANGQHQLLRRALVVQVTGPSDWSLPFSLVRAGVRAAEKCHEAGSLLNFADRSHLRQVLLEQVIHVLALVLLWLRHRPRCAWILLQAVTLGACSRFSPRAILLFC